MGKLNRLNTTKALAKAAECRDLAKHASKPEERVALEHMAETWDRIAFDMAPNGSAT
jgi:hypothetical protein